ncbi:hypothetical protein FF011L_12450 [Roseimaritima multifibrata]|uniref:Toprim domain-containing protein n=1 Tax=Roseimaritima multifibrata TaxID=1930274 RepID=A0A517MC80_9BACT|nr:DUF3991 and TOPRIM domain-containing protein [Roseimaritima multifibrata]QDS92499.1 hypothetical protein FF011L_12450 [Roseimaritima multifibrata]
MDRHSELAAFKRLDLVQYCQSRSFVIDQRASSRSAIVLRSPSDEKIGVSKSTEGTFIFYDYKGGRGGSIIDFCQWLDGGTLGEVRKTLRAYDPTSFSVPSALPFKLVSSTHDETKVLAAWMQARSIGASGHPYLTQYRRIALEVQTAPLFRDRIRIDSRSNALFPHFSTKGTLCGFEIKNGGASKKSFTGFSPNGLKGLACSRPRETDCEMVVCETAIDMLSLASIEGIEKRRFFSTGGQVSEMQLEALQSAASRMPTNSTRILLALDNDKAGHELARRIADALSNSKLKVVPYFPPDPGADWNDMLQRTIRESNRTPEPIKS